jgi:hypothetical protein
MGVTPWCYDYLRVLVHWAGKARKKLGHNTGWHNVAAARINFSKNIHCKAADGIGGGGVAGQLTSLPRIPSAALYF